MTSPSLMNMGTETVARVVGVAEPIFAAIGVQIFDCTRAHIRLLHVVVLMKRDLHHLAADEILELCLVHRFALLLAEYPVREHLVRFAVAQNKLVRRHFVIIKHCHSPTMLSHLAKFVEGTLYRTLYRRRPYASPSYTVPKWGSKCSLCQRICSASPSSKEVFVANPNSRFALPITASVSNWSPGRRCTTTISARCPNMASMARMPSSVVCVIFEPMLTTSPIAFLYCSSTCVIPRTTSPTYVKLRT